MCTTAACIKKKIFWESSASEVSLTLVPVGGCRFEYQIVRACDEAGSDPNWDSVHSFRAARNMAAGQGRNCRQFAVFADLK